MPPVGCRPEYFGWSLRLEPAFRRNGKEKSPPEELRRARSVESRGRAGRPYIAFTFMAASSGNHAFHTSGWARRNSAAASAPSAWFSSM